MMKKSGSAEKKSRRRNQKLQESMSLLFAEAKEIEAALQLIKLSFCHSSNKPGEETTTTSSCMKVKLKELQEHDEEEEEDCNGKTCGISPPSSCSTITRTSVKDFGTEETAEEDQACSSRLIRKIKKSKFRSVFDIYNSTKPLNSIHIRHN